LRCRIHGLHDRKLRGDREPIKVDPADFSTSESCGAS
jgi:hypothetical protein